MPNEQNLEKGIATQFKSGEEAAENGRKGGIASGEAKRKKRDIRRALEALLEKDYFVEEYGTLSGAEAIAVRQMERALDGDTKAFEVVRDTVGQKPVDKVMIADVDPAVIEEVERAVLDE